jgi:TRAP-type C4-dicarboxylate transport system substrate-binding protein
MRRTIRRLPAWILVASLALSQALAATTVDLATLAPDGSPWHKQLKRMGNEWQQGTGARVKLRIFAGGVAGDDPAIVRKIRIGRLDGGAISSVGLAEIDEAFGVFAIPLFFDSYEEFAYVLDKLGPTLAERIEKKGFVLVHWIHGGWIHIFSKKRVATVSDLQSVKMFTSAGDHEMVRVWQENGFKPVPLSTTDVLTGLQTGMIEGMPAPPVGALAMQWFRHTPYMLEPGVAPLVGATLVSKRTWNRISEADRAILLKSGKETERRLAVEIPQKDRSSIAEMEKRGLEVIHLDEGAGVEEWRATAGRFADKMRSAVPGDVFELAVRYRDEFRQRASSQGGR